MEMGVFVTYRLLDGDIFSTRTGDNLDSETWESELLSLDFFDDECDVIFCADLDIHPDSHWVDAGAVKEKTPFPALTVNNGRITQVPVNTNVQWPDGVETNETTGVVEFVSNVSGKFDFRFEHAAHFTDFYQVTYTHE
jgi:hypothetical protein